MSTAHSTFDVYDSVSVDRLPMVVITISLGGRNPPTILVRNKPKYFVTQISLFNSSHKKGNLLLQAPINASNEVAISCITASYVGEKDVDIGAENLGFDFRVG